MLKLLIIVLYYCLVIYLQTNLRLLVCLQKRVLRIIAKSTFESHSGPIFKELELQNSLILDNLLKNLILSTQKSCSK